MEVKRNKLIIIQQNIQGWYQHKDSFINAIRFIDPDIILLNDTGVPDRTHIKIPGYILMQSNKTNERHRGSWFSNSN